MNTETRKEDGTDCRLCGTAFVAGESQYDYWWSNGGTAEKSHICNRCYSVVKRHIACQTEPPDAPVPDDAINVVWFADDMPSPEKWEAAKKHIATLNEQELVRQAGNVLQAIHLDYVAAYYGMGVYKARLRLEEILAELHLRIAVKQVAKQFKPMLERQDREIELYNMHDYDGLLREGFIDQKGYELLPTDGPTDDIVSPDVIVAEERANELTGGGCTDASGE